MGSSAQFYGGHIQSSNNATIWGDERKDTDRAHR